MPLEEATMPLKEVKSLLEEAMLPHKDIYSSTKTTMYAHRKGILWQPQKEDLYNNIS